MNLIESIQRIKRVMGLSESGHKFVHEQEDTWHPPMVKPEEKPKLYGPMFNQGSFDCKSCDQRTLKNINTLNPEMQEKAKMFIDKVANDLNIKLTITQAYRSPEEQDKLYCQGRPKDEYCKRKKLPTKGQIVTTKKGGESNHNFGKAFDVYFNENGVVNVHKNITDEVGKIGQDLGLVWGGGGGKFANFQDPPHFES